jgi:hypothetical protein
MCIMLGTSRNSYQSRRIVSRHRSSQFSLEELSEDDVGYDADIEVVRPDYEDAESGNEDDAQGDDSSIDSEDHLADQLKGLYCDPNMVSSDPQKSPQKGRKRMSKDMEGTQFTSSMWNGRSDMEILELSVHTDDNPPAKRQRNRLTGSKSGERIVRVISGEREEHEAKSGTESSTFVSSPSPIEGPATSTSEMQDLEMTG